MSRTRKRSGAIQVQTAQEVDEFAFRHHAAASVESGVTVWPARLTEQREGKSQGLQFKLTCSASSSFVTRIFSTASSERDVDAEEAHERPVALLLLRLPPPSLRVSERRLDILERAVCWRA